MGVPEPEEAPMTTQSYTGPATERQASFIRTLLDEREWPSHWSGTPDVARERLAAGTVSKQMASTVIEGLLAAPRRSKAAREPGAHPSVVADHEGQPVDVPASQYAIRSEGVWKFYRVTKPTTGRWAGRVFVDHLVGSPGAFRKYPVKGQAASRVLTAIAQATYADGDRDLTGPEAAAVAFSREHGVCAACSSPLTDPDSIELGLGPVCAGRFEW